MMNYFKDEAELRDLVRAFETCEIHPAEFKHYQHLAVALWYVAYFPYEEASTRMRNGIQKLAAVYGKTGYHETITIFWLRLVRDFFEDVKPGESITTMANAIAGKFSDKNLINDYYSAELLASRQAKEELVEPDLKAFGTGEEN